MKVKEMIELLKQEDPDDEVHMAFPYGDHWNNKCAPPVTGLSVEKVAYSEYHENMKLFDENPPDKDEYPDAHDAVVLNFDDFDAEDARYRQEQAFQDLEDEAERDEDDDEDDD